MTEIVTLSLAGYGIGIAVTEVQDVVRLPTVTPVPRAAPWIAGMMNLRGHIVTAIDLRARLGLPPHDGEKRRMCAVVGARDDAYALIVDSVGDVIAVDPAHREADPATLPAIWHAVSKGVIRRDDELLIELDVNAVISGELAAAA